jgi:hypothetical protein
MFFYGNGNVNRHLVTGFTHIRESYQQLKRVELINDRMSHVTLKVKISDAFRV